MVLRETESEETGEMAGEGGGHLFGLARVDGAAVIYEQDTLKIHGCLILQCH